MSRSWHPPRLTLVSLCRSTNDFGRFRRSTSPSSMRSTLAHWSRSRAPSRSPPSPRPPPPRLPRPIRRRLRSPKQVCFPADYVMQLSVTALPTDPCTTWCDVSLAAGAKKTAKPKAGKKGACFVRHPSQRVQQPMHAATPKKAAAKKPKAVKTA